MQIKEENQKRKDRKLEYLQATSEQKQKGEMDKYKSTV